MGKSIYSRVLFLAIAIVFGFSSTVIALECDDKPNLLLPVNNAQDVSMAPTLAIGVPQTVLQSCELEEVQWQISADPGFNNIVYNTGYISNPPHNVHKVPSNTLSPGTTYYWRVQLDMTLDSGPGTIPATVFSGWTSSRKFTTQALQFELQCNWPAIYHKSPSDNATVNTRTPTIEVGFLGAAIAPICQYDGVAWQVGEDVADFDLLALLTSPGLELNNPVPLRDNTTYYWHARLYDDNGNYGPWTEITSFEVAELNINFEPPCSWGRFENVSPNEGEQNVELDPNLEIALLPNQLVPAPVCEHGSTHWEIATDQAFNNVILDFPRDRAQWWPGVIAIPRTNLKIRFDDFGNSPLEQGTTYYWRAKMQTPGGAHESGWSTPTSFTTAGEANRNVQPNPPPNNAQNLCDLDANQNGFLDDAEFFNTIDLWIGELIENQFFFDAVDAWIAQDQICPAATAASSFNITTQQVASNMIQFSVTGTSFSSQQLEIYNLQGTLLHQQSASGGSLSWNMRGANRSVLANGVYLYRVTLRDLIGSDVGSEIRKLVVVR